MERRLITIRGIVQGVGFRPFVYELAVRFDLTGFVKNQAGGVEIEVEGDTGSLNSFLTELSAKPPPWARIESLDWRPRPTRGDRDFRIGPSEVARDGPIFISPDVATCADCLKELFDPADRRFRYPFLNCTSCGPRLTIVTGAPYDRSRTSMAAFTMCPACQSEYDDPGNRRFHAQPTCCTVCGPRLRVLDGQGHSIATDDPLAFFAASLRAGRLGALKGLGGYHLACDARNAVAVAELRKRKHRDEKPFALMVRDDVAAEGMAEIEPAERELLLSSRRPIVLLRKRHPSPVAAEVAPRNPFLGVMLPYTPLHHLLLREVDAPLVMTSGNRSDEPIAYVDDDAVKRLAGIADLFLVHDRPIQVRCDDSVTRIVNGIEMPLRRSRGYAPSSISLPMSCPVPILAVGGQMKGTLTLGRDHHAFMSHHLGDLDHFDAYRSFLSDTALYEHLFAIRPMVLVHDLHPDYASTRYARQRCEKERLEALAIQHHHAHMASCMAEHGLVEPVIGVSFDGSGRGTDGAIWGGEFLVGDYGHFRRAAHLRYVGLPGGDQAVREPWRMALAHLLDATGSGDLLENRIAKLAFRTVRQMIERGINTPLTSSAGRLFDAVAALVGIRDYVNFEGQAAMELEWSAADTVSDGAYSWEVERESVNHSLLIDTRPIIRGVVADIRASTHSSKIARRFHETMIEMIVGVCRQIRHEAGINVVVLSGGVFMNVLLVSGCLERLRGEGFRAYRQQRVPCNDGGLSLGQMAIAMFRHGSGGGR
ncbi:MAG: carbamoyltransferase HypF [Planctomycetes bacterium]|nr:carbamoyltransferase HypF [Planctomycetota bacterium]